MDDKVLHIYKQLCKAKDKNKPQTPMICEKCNFYSYATGDMNRHNKSTKHLNNISDNNIDKKYNCEKCNYKTNDKSHMTRHILTHKEKEEQLDYIKILTT